VSVKFDVHEIVRAKSLEGLGFTPEKAHAVATSKETSLKDKYFGVFSYFPFQKSIGEFKTAAAFRQYVNERLHRRVTDVLGVTGMSKLMSSARRLSYLASETSIIQYFREVLLGRVEVYETGEILPSRIVEDSVRTLKAEGADEAALLGRIKYLIRMKSAPLVQKVENLLTQGVTWEETLDSRLMG
jgi:hypothetical protein